MVCTIGTSSIGTADSVYIRQGDGDGDGEGGGGDGKGNNNEIRTSAIAPLRRENSLSISLSMATTKGVGVLAAEAFLSTIPTKTSTIDTIDTAKVHHRQGEINKYHKGQGDKKKISKKSKISNNKGGKGKKGKREVEQSGRTSKSGTKTKAKTKTGACVFTYQDQQYLLLPSNPSKHSKKDKQEMTEMTKLRLVPLCPSLQENGSAMTLSRIRELALPHARLGLSTAQLRERTRLYVMRIVMFMFMFRGLFLCYIVVILNSSSALESPCLPLQ